MKMTFTLQITLAFCNKETVSLLEQCGESLVVEVIFQKRVPGFH